MRSKLFEKTEKMNLQRFLQLWKHTHGISLFNCDICSWKEI